jgi:hypothetical protein
VRLLPLLPASTYLGVLCLLLVWLFPVLWLLVIGLALVAPFLVLAHLPDR